MLDPSKFPSQLISPEERKPLPEENVHLKGRFFFVAYQLIYWYLGDLWYRRFRAKHRQRIQHLEKQIQKCGMLWIRVAQTLFLRSSLLASRIGKALMELHDSSGAYPFPLIRQVIEEELGCPLEEVFSKFPEKPFATNAVSQTHRAQLAQNKTWVAVKVQNPYAREIFEKDLKIIKWTFRLLKFFSIKPDMRWDDLYHELNEIVIRELNYQYEANALIKLRKNLKGQPLYVPSLYQEFSSSRLLVMTFIQGALFHDIMLMKKQDPERLDHWLQNNNIDLERVCSRLFQSTYRQIFEDNFFHGDLHTRNIILLRNSELAFIGCRSTGSLDLESLSKQKMYLHALAQNETTTAAEIYFLMTSSLPNVDLVIVKEELKRLWRIWSLNVGTSDIPYEKKSMRSINSSMNQLLKHYKFAAQWSYSKLNRTLLHLDNILSIGYPKINYLAHLQRYFEREEKRDIINKTQNLPYRLTASLLAMQELPKRQSEYQLFHESIMRRQAQVVQGSSSKIGALLSCILSITAFAIFLALGYLFLVYLKHHYWDLTITMLLGEQLNHYALKFKHLDQASWLSIFVIGCSFFLFLFLQSQKHITAKNRKQQKVGL